MPFVMLHLQVRHVGDAVRPFEQTLRGPGPTGAGRPADRLQRRYRQLLRSTPAL